MRSKLDQFLLVTGLTALSKVHFVRFSVCECTRASCFVLGAPASSILVFSGHSSFVFRKRLLADNYTNTKRVVRPAYIEFLRVYCNKYTYMYIYALPEKAQRKPCNSHHFTRCVLKVLTCLCIFEEISNQLTRNSIMVKINKR